jgi:predicted nucleic acid-binding protein
MVQQNSPHHQISLDALAVLRKNQETLCVIPQNYIEFWAVATRQLMYNGLGLTIDETKQEITQLKTLFVTKPDTQTIFTEWEQIVSQYQVTGKPTHDARIVAAMIAHGLTHLLTFNVDDFKRYKNIITVATPQEVITS